MEYIVFRLAGALGELETSGAGGGGAVWRYPTLRETTENGCPAVSFTSMNDWSLPRLGGHHGGKQGSPADTSIVVGSGEWGSPADASSGVGGRG